MSVYMIAEDGLPYAVDLAIFPSASRLGRGIGTALAAEVVNGALALVGRFTDSVVTIGTFDGVHLGHRALLESAVRAAEQGAGPSIAYTFDPHPSRAIPGRDRRPLLQTLSERVRCMRDLGIDHVVVEHFDEAFGQIDARLWVERYLLEAMAPRHVIVGFNHRFGRGGAGDTDLLASVLEGHGVTLQVVSPVEYEGTPVSSSRIRSAVEVGDIALATALLSHPFGIEGEVIRGDQRGRTIGFPTANLRADQPLLPPNGVYVSEALIEGVWRPAITNLGVRPTFDGATRLLETFVFDFEGDLYGRSLPLRIQARVRPERKFDGREALLAAIAEDVLTARRWHEVSR